MVQIARRRNVQLLVVAGEHGVVPHDQELQAYRCCRLGYVDIVSPSGIVQDVGVRVQPLGRELLVAVPDDEEDVAVIVSPVDILPGLVLHDRDTQHRIAHVTVDVVSVAVVIGVSTHRVRRRTAWGASDDLVPVGNAVAVAVRGTGIGHPAVRPELHLLPVEEEVVVRIAVKGVRRAVDLQARVFDAACRPGHSVPDIDMPCIARF
ncbi:hypothetical protein DSECCO2_453990 [anaerobic digester metagenome]